MIRFLSHHTLYRMTDRHYFPHAELCLNVHFCYATYKTIRDTSVESPMRAPTNQLCAHSQRRNGSNVSYSDRHLFTLIKTIRFGLTLITSALLNISPGKAEPSPRPTHSTIRIFQCSCKHITLENYIPVMIKNCM